MEKSNDISIAEKKSQVIKKKGRFCNCTNNIRSVGELKKERIMETPIVSDYQLKEQN